jgi:hypothetical protein
VTVALEKEETKQEKKEDNKEEEEYKKFYVDSDVVELHATCIYRAQEKWVHNDTVA